MTPAIDVTAEQRETILSLLERHLPGTTAWAYGSRVKRTSRPTSDLDLVVFATPEQGRRVGDLREAFEEGDLPFPVDMFVWDEIPENFRKRIEADHVVLVGKPERGAGGNWPTARLGDCIEINDSTYSPKEEWPFVNYLDTGNITENRITEIQHLIVGRDKIPSRARRKVRPGEIVYSTVRPNQRHFGLLRDVPENFLASTGFSIIRGKEGVACTDFIYWFLAQNHIVELLHTIAEHSTTAYPSIRPSDIEGLEIELPPLPEQRAIARILGALDDRIELNRRMNETLEAMARALFKSWFVDFDPVRARAEGRDTGLPDRIADLFPDRLVDSELGEIPEGWRVGTLDDIALLNPESWSVRNAPETVVYVDLANTKWGHIDKVDTHSWGTAPSRARRVLRSGDTIVGTVRPGNGSFALIGHDGLTGSTGFAVLRPKASYDREIIWCVATSRDNLDRLAHLADGGAYPAVRPRAVAETSVVLANVPARGAFSSMTAPWFDLIENNKRESRRLASLRDTLLPRLISGELRLGETVERLESSA